MEVLSSSSCLNCELYQKNIQKIEERFIQYKKLLIHTNKLLEKYDILIQHSKIVEDKLKREQASAAQVKKILVPLLNQLLPLQNVKTKYESEIKKFEHEIEVLKGIIIAEQQQTKQYSALSSRLEADLKSANAIIENTKEQLNATKKDNKLNATAQKSYHEKLYTTLQSALELSCLLKENKLLPHKFLNHIRVWKKQLTKLGNSFHENHFSPMSIVDTDFESSKYSSDEEDLINCESSPNSVDANKSCHRNDIGINTNLTMQNHRFQSISSSLHDKSVQVTDLDAAKLSEVYISYSDDYLTSQTVSKTPNDMSPNLDEFCASSPDSEIDQLEETEICHLEGTEMGQLEGTEMDQLVGTEMGQLVGTEMGHLVGTEMGHLGGTEMDHLEGTEMDHLEGTEMDHLEGTEMDHLEGTEMDHLEGTEIDYLDGTEINPVEEIQDANFIVGTHENYDLEKILDDMKIDIPIILSPMMPDGPCDKCFFPKRDVSTTMDDYCDALANHDNIPINVGVQCTISIPDKSYAEVSVQCNFTSNKSDEILNAQMQKKHDAVKIMSNISSSLYDTHLQPNVLQIQILDELKKIFAALEIKNSVHEPFCRIKSTWENFDIKTEQEKFLHNSQIGCSELDDNSKVICKSNQYSSFTGNCCSCTSSKNVHNSGNLASFQKDTKTKDKHKLQFSQGSVRYKKKFKKLNSKLYKRKLVESSSGCFMVTTNIGLKILKKSELKPEKKSRFFNSKRHKILNMKRSFRKMSLRTNSSDNCEFTTLAQVLRQKKSLSLCPKICSANSGSFIDREDTVASNVDVIQGSEKNTMQNSLPAYLEKLSESLSESESDSESEFKTENIPEVNSKFMLNAANISNDTVICSANSVTCIGSEVTGDSNVDVIQDAVENTTQNISSSVYSEKPTELSSESDSDSEFKSENMPEMNNKSLLNAADVSNDRNVSKRASHLQLGKVRDKDSVLLPNESLIINSVINTEQPYVLDNASTDLGFESGVTANFTDVSTLREGTNDMLKSTDKLNVVKCPTVCILEENQRCKSNEVTNIYTSRSENFALTRNLPICSTSKSDNSIEKNSVSRNVDDNNIDTRRFATNFNVSPMYNNELEQNHIVKSKIVHNRTLKCNSENMVVSCTDKTKSSEITSDCDKMKNNAYMEENAVSRKISTKSVVCHKFMSPAAVVTLYSNRNRSLKAKALASEFKENFQKKSTSIKCQAIGCKTQKLKANISLDKHNVEMLFGRDSDSSDELDQTLKPDIKSSLDNYSKELNVVNLISSNIKPVLRKATSCSHIQSVGLPENPIKRTKSLPIFFQSPVSYKSFIAFKTCSTLDQKPRDSFEQFQRKGVKRKNLYVSTKQSDTGLTKININENVKEVESTISQITFTPNKHRIAHIPGERKSRISTVIIDKKQLHCKPLTTSSFDHSENLNTHTPAEIAQKNNLGGTLIQKYQSEEFGGCKFLPKATTLAKPSCEYDMNNKNMKCLSKLGTLRHQFVKQKRNYKIMSRDEIPKSCQTVNSQVIPTDTRKRLCVRNEADVEFDNTHGIYERNHTPISPKDTNNQNVSNIISDHRSEVFSGSKILHNCTTRSECFDSTLKSAISNSSDSLIPQNFNTINSSKDWTTNKLHGKKLNTRVSVPFDSIPSSESISSNVLTQCSFTSLNTESPTKDVLKSSLEEFGENPVTTDDIFGSPKIKSHLENKQLVFRKDRVNEVKHTFPLKKVYTDSKHPVFYPDEEKVVNNLCETVTSYPTSMSITNKCFIHEKGGVLRTALKLRNNIKEKKCCKNYEGNLKLEMDNFLSKSVTSATLFEAANLFNGTSDVESLSRCIFEVVQDDSTELDRSFTPPALPLTPTQQKLLTLIMVMQKKFVNFVSLIDVFLSAVECFVLKLSNNAPSVSLLCKIARFYCAVCRIVMCTNRVHAFCYDALYCLKRKCFPLIYTILICYPEALPKAAIGMESPRCVAMVHIIMSTNISSVNATFKLGNLKHLLKDVYGYKNLEELMLDNILEIFLRKLRYTTPNSREVQASLILLSKIHGLNWTITYLIHKGIIPIIRDWFEGKLPEAPVLQSVEILGAALKPYSDVDIKKEVSVLGGILSNNKASFNLKMATVMSLSKLMCHNYTMVANFLYNWIPEEPVPKEFLINLSNLLLTRPYSSWMTYLTSKKN